MIIISKELIKNLRKKMSKTISCLYPLTMRHINQTYFYGLTEWYFELAQIDKIRHAYCQIKYSW